MTIAGRCPHLHTIVLVRNTYSEQEKVEVDYCAVKKAFPKLVFTEDVTVLDFDVYKLPV